MYRIYAILFLIVLFLLAFLSDAGLVRYYVNGAESNIEWKPDAGSRFETDYITNFYRKMQFINGNGVLRRVFGQREMNEVVKLENGYLTELVEELPEERLSESAEEIARINRMCMAHEIPFLYVMTPYKISKYDPELPAGEEDYSNQNMDVFLRKLDELGVAYMDLRETIHAGGINQYELFYRTDHHWTTEGGFYIYTKLAERMEDMLDIRIDENVMDPASYRITTYAKWHLGSLGQRVGIWYGGIDDFDLIELDFETQLTHNGESGSFSEILIDREPLEKRNVETRGTYDFVLNNGFGYFKNAGASNNKRVLIITDSMGKAVIPYMILSFAESYNVYVYDPTDITGRFLNDWKPDAVLIMEYPTLLEKTELYSFFE